VRLLFPVDSLTLRRLPMVRPAIAGSLTLRSRRVARGMVAGFALAFLMGGGGCRCQGEDRRLEVEPRVLRYLEALGQLEFQIDWLDAGERVVFVPNAQRWSVEMAAWARERRAEILAHVKRLSEGHDFTWHEY
jgi:hypothetical protein